MANENCSRRNFLLASAAVAVAGCTSASAEATAGICPTRFPPMQVEGLENRPDFWRVRPDEIISLCAGATKCSRKEVICHTPLGYPVYALFYGDFNEPPPQTNWSAGQGSTTYRNYTARPAGGKQTFLFLAGVHGAEPETVAGAVNLIRALETGADFRGRRHDELAQLVSRYRFIVVPCVNMDGRAISPDHLRGADWNRFRHVSQGTWKDGSRIGWRGSKAWFPLPLDRVAYPGGYPNADGYNIMHDAAPGDIRTAEARALLKLAARWRVDALLNGHSFEHRPTVLAPTAIDYPEKLARGRAIRYRCNKALFAAGLTPSPPKPPESDIPSKPGINLNNVLSLASGAIALTLECSVSYDRPDKPPRVKPTRTYTFDELMEPVFVTLREYLADGLEKPFLVRGGEKMLDD